MKQIVLNSLELQNFRKLSNLSINFNGLQLITGPNGSGKSSIFEAIYVALYNRRVNGKPAKSTIKKGTSSAYLRLEFEVNNDKFILERVIGKGSYVKLTVNDLNEIKGSQCKEIIESLIPPDILKLAMLQDVNVKQLLTSYVDIESIVKNVQDEKKSVDENYRNILAVYNSRKSRYEELKQTINNYKERESYLKGELKNLYDQIMNIKNLLPNDSELDKYVSFKTQVKDLYEEAFRKRISDLEQQYRQKQFEKQKLQDELAIIEGSYRNKFQSIDQEIKELYMQVESFKSEKENSIRDSELEISNIQRYIDNLVTEKKELEQSLSNTGICPTCKQPLKDKSGIEEKVRNLQITIDSETEKLESKTVLLENQKREIEQQIAEFSKRIESKINEYQNELKSLEEEFKQNKERFESEIVKLDDDIKEIHKRIEEVRQSFNMEDFIDEQLSARGLDKEVFLQLDNLLEQKQNLRDLEIRYSQLYGEYNAITGSIKQFENELQELEQEIMHDEVEIRNVERYLQDLEILSNTRLWKTVALNKLKDYLNAYIDEHSNLDLKVELQLDENENINIFVQNLNGDLVTIDDISQGESVIAKIILYNALRKFLSRDIYFSTMFLDEVIDRLDRENSEKVINYLRELADEGNNILVITHNTFAQELPVWDDVVDMAYV